MSVQVMSVHAMSTQGPTAFLSRRYQFCASHRLHAESYDGARNMAVFGKCNNPHGHGHNYTVQVTVSGPIDPVTGMVTNLADLDAFAQTELLERFDHTNLNLLPCFADRVSSTENLAMEVYSIFERFPHARLEHVRVEETPNNSFDYLGPDTGLRGRDAARFRSS
jgi:6-pyruvoyltetrahydropterin/6-carboxytetrahydropterin synthase